MKILKTIIKITVIVVAVLSLACYGLYIYAKHFNNKELEVERLYLSELPVNTSEFEEDFEELHQIVIDNYSLYPSKHLNMDSLRQSFIPRVQQAKTTTAYGLLVQEYISALQCAHAVTAFRGYTGGVHPVLIQDSLFVSEPNEYLIHNGFKDKDRIIAINNLPLNEWISQNEKYSEASTSAWRRMKTARYAFFSYADSIRSYTLQRGTDTLNITLPLKRKEYFPSNDEKMAEAKVLQDSIGYLAINSMGSPVMDEFKKAYPQIKQLPYLIIDIRQNSGGNSSNGRDICKYFIRQDQPHCLGGKAAMHPEADAYKGKIYLLTSTYTCSAAESFTLDMKESGNVVLVGDPTCGDTGNNPLIFRTSHKTYFRIPTREPDLSPKGFPLEGVGIPPHHLISQTVADFMNNEDTQLQYTIGLITKN